MQLDLQTLATRAHVHRNTARHASDAESVQSYLRESVRVMRTAVELVGDVDKAILWFKNHPLPTFDYKMPQDLV